MGTVTWRHVRRRSQSIDADTRLRKRSSTGSEESERSLPCGREGATKMTLRNRGEPSGFAAVTAPVMAVAMRRANDSDLRQLKTLLEA